MDVTVTPLQRIVSARTGDNLLEVLRTRQVPISYSCMSGRCGACRCRVLSGNVGHRRHRDQRALHAGPDRAGVPDDAGRIRNALAGRPARTPAESAHACRRRHLQRGCALALGRRDRSRRERLAGAARVTGLPGRSTGHGGCGPPPAAAARRAGRTHLRRCVLCGGCLSVAPPASILIRHYRT